jgi:hypothetical protein
MKQIAIFVLIAIVGTLFGVMGYLSYSEIEEHEHEHSVEIEGKEMRDLTVQEVADLWEIDSGVLLSGIIEEFGLKENYNEDSILEDIREEYKFSPALVKDMAEEIKQNG